MKQITEQTILKQGNKTFQSIESEGVIYWRDEYLNVIAQSQDKLEEIPVINLGSCFENPIKKFMYFAANNGNDALGAICNEAWNILTDLKMKSNPNQYTLKDIEKAFVAAWCLLSKIKVL